MCTDFNGVQSQLRKQIQFDKFNEFNTLQSSHCSYISRKQHFKGKILR